MPHTYLYAGKLPVQIELPIKVIMACLHIIAVYMDDKELFVGTKRWRKNIFKRFKRLDLLAIFVFCPAGSNSRK